MSSSSSKPNDVPLSNLTLQPDLGRSGRQEGARMLSHVHDVIRDLKVYQLRDIIPRPSRGIPPPTSPEVSHLLEGTHSSSLLLISSNESNMVGFKKLIDYNVQSAPVIDPNTLRCSGFLDVRDLVSLLVAVEEDSLSTQQQQQQQQQHPQYPVRRATGRPSPRSLPPASPLRSPFPQGAGHPNQSHPASTVASVGGTSGAVHSSVPSSASSFSSVNSLHNTSVAGNGTSGVGINGHLLVHPTHRLTKASKPLPGLVASSATEDELFPHPHPGGSNERVPSASAVSIASASISSGSTSQPSTPIPSETGALFPGYSAASSSSSSATGVAAVNGGVSSAILSSAVTPGGSPIPLSDFQHHSHSHHLQQQPNGSQSGYSSISQTIREDNDNIDDIDEGDDDDDDGDLALPVGPLSIVADSLLEKPPIARQGLRHSSQTSPLLTSHHGGGGALSRPPSGTPVYPVPDDNHSHSALTDDTTRHPTAESSASASATAVVATTGELHSASHHLPSHSRQTVPPPSTASNGSTASSSTAHHHHPSSTPTHPPVSTSGSVHSTVSTGSTTASTAQPHSYIFMALQNLQNRSYASSSFLTRSPLTITKQLEHRPIDFSVSYLSARNRAYMIQYDNSILSCIEALATIPDLNRVMVVKGTGRNIRIIDIVSQSDIVKLLYTLLTRPEVWVEYLTKAYNDNEQQQQQQQQLDMEGSPHPVQTQEKVNTCVNNAIKELQYTINETNLGSAPVITVSEAEQLISTLEVLSANKISGVAIINNDKHLIAATSGADLKLYLQSPSSQRLHQRVVDFLRDIHGENLEKSVVKLYSSNTLYDLIMKLGSVSTHRVFIIDEHHHPLRVVSVQDIVCLLHYGFSQNKHYNRLTRLKSSSGTGIAGVSSNLSPSPVSTSTTPASGGELGMGDHSSTTPHGVPTHTQPQLTSLSQSTSFLQNASQMTNLSQHDSMGSLDTATPLSTSADITLSAACSGVSTAATMPPGQTSFYASGATTSSVTTPGGMSDSDAMLMTSPPSNTDSSSPSSSGLFTPK